MSPSPAANTAQQNSPVDYSNVDSLPEMWAIAAERFRDVLVLKDPHYQPAVELTYGQLYQQIQQFASGLQHFGIQSNPEAPSRVALIADNSHRWLIADQGIMLAGAVDAVRSPQADRQELLYILAHSDSMALVAEDQATLKKLQPQLQDLPIQLVVLLSDQDPSDQDPEDSAIKVVNFRQILAAGAQAQAAFKPVFPSPDSLATLMYTSGTSGQPKGVMLSHNNLMSQVKALPEIVQPQPGSPVLSILPVWHSYERSFENFIFSQGCTQIYTNIRQVKRDLQSFKPHYMVAVPRLWESIYDGVQKQFREQPESKQRLIRFFLDASRKYIQARRVVKKLDLDNLDPSPLAQAKARAKMIALGPVHQLGDKLVYRQVREATGGEFEFIVSGGGSLADYLEDFFEIVGIEILGGYGLTETTPITNVRRPWRNLRGADGQPLLETQIRVVDPETRRPLPSGQQGLILIRGPQVMIGYSKNPEATAKVIDSEGWFDSGDLGWVTDQDDLVITGRAKDTIVLTNGENIEPQPIENACVRSPYIDQIVLVGQDQRSLGALIVPNLEALQKWALSQNCHLELPESEKLGPEPPPNSQPLESKPIQDLFRQELTREVKNRPGYRPDDRIGPFRLLLEPFSIENGLMTQKLSIRRPAVIERYHDMINGMFD